MQNKNNKQITIIIPTFNRADLVSKTIDSALAQTIECEIIVCDHGSSDNTPEVVKSYGNKVTYIRREKDFGPHFCWLEGILNAKGELIHLHFDDDFMEPTFIEKTSNLMNDDVGVVFTDACMYNPYTNELFKNSVFNFAKKWGTGIHNSKKLEKALLKKLMLSPALCLYRKKDFIDAILPGNLHIDFGGNYHGVGVDLLVTLLACNRYPKFACVAESLTKFGHHENSITVNASADFERNNRLNEGYEAFRRYYKLLKFYQNNWLIRLLCRTRSKHRFSVIYKKFLMLLGLRKKGL